MSGTGHDIHGIMDRPPFKPTPSQRRRFERMAAKGMSRSEIADVIGVGLLTVVKSFSDECKRGYTTCRRDLVACMWTAAKRGRVGAILWLEQCMREREEPAGKPLGNACRPHRGCSSGRDMFAVRDGRHIPPGRSPYCLLPLRRFGRECPAVSHDGE